MTQSNEVQILLHNSSSYPGIHFRLKCFECGRDFGSRAILKEHSQIHVRAKCVTCDDCGKFWFMKFNYMYLIYAISYTHI